MTKYLDQFTNMAKEGIDAYTLLGDRLLVEAVKKNTERKVGSLYMPTDMKGIKSSLTKEPHFVVVLAKGPGYYDDNDPEKTTDVEVEPGDIILVGPASVNYFSFFGDLTNYEPDTIGITRATEIQMRFRGKEGYDQVFAILNRSAKKEVVEGAGEGFADLSERNTG